MSFKSVSSQIDFPALEKDLLKWWYESGVVAKYLAKNSSAKTKFTFLDGPITANNPMGVHHAWGRSYKDLWQKYHTMKGDRQRYQNGFDCQGLWVEVEVEKELGFKNKKDIETYGIANFVNKCKDRVYKYSAIQTEQTKRLGNFMDWENSYFTMSDENNYAIWNFIKVCHDRGWLYKGHDSVPWCPRCETAISQHEVLTEDYKEITHDSIVLSFPLMDHPEEFLLVWTTTPWTIPANIAVAVDAKLEYALVESAEGRKYWLAAGAVDRIFKTTERKIIRTVMGKKLAGLKYRGPFDNLPEVHKVKSEFADKFHTVVLTDDRILPITIEEGTGLVHTAVSAGEEDFKLGKKLGLPLIPVIADNADYLPGLGQFSGLNAKKTPRLILDFLEAESQTDGPWVFEIFPYKHRYPACWRCKTELVWKVADEWYIAMDKPDPTHPTKKTLRAQMVAVAKKINWMPSFGLDRELDWLKNMHDWLISKKNRYWGLALPIYECQSCGTFEVISSRTELEKRAVSGWDKFIGHSPHRPWIDEVKIKCPTCDQIVSRISDVGNPWLDAGIVPISTLPEEWFPADFITESFPGQFKNWFYSMIAMSTVLRKTHPYKNVLGYASLVGEDGRPMHKSWGNSIEFNEGADKIGADVMRWMFALQNPEQNLAFGYKKADEVRRQFHIMLWNIYNFFVTYANLNKISLKDLQTPVGLSVLDQWILARLNQTISNATVGLDKFDAYTASHSIDDFVHDLSLWYVRRSRDRVNPSSENADDRLACFRTLHTCLVKLSQIMAPLNPYITEEMYRNLTGEESVHLSDWPTATSLTDFDKKLIEETVVIRKIVEMGLFERKTAQLKVRQPLSKINITAPQTVDPALIYLLEDELNVKSVNWSKNSDLTVKLDTELTPELISEGKNRELIRQVQDLRKTKQARLDQHIRLFAPKPESPALLSELKRQTLAVEFNEADSIDIELL